MLSRSTLITALLTLALIASSFTFYTHLRRDGQPPSALPGEHNNNNNNKTKVPLEIHIMSKCPDARDCVELLVAPALKNVSDIVDFRMSFIGRRLQDGTTACMHGPSECLGNSIHLCAARLYPDTYLPFSLCLLHDYARLPDQDFIESCASKHDVSFEKVNECISSLDPDGGMALLAGSVDRSRRAGVTTSCTVRVEEKVWCVRDGGKWRDCDGGSGVDDLVREVEERYRKGSAVVVESMEEEEEYEAEKPGMVRQERKSLRQMIDERIIWRG
ncbi:uncharacterized protein H6S33_004815 [Morchella sextelata]|uniref:uncharacterized protein n=1 Tax=Morchella sextelata TaxID=1174677 RepID=UPI001D045734|nr:uncharacterized protein H6S33_004815 [Morchella sextelata]KAH0605593.1 hypothetical protein H6S33_004815 [Morchella sextelata]